MKTGLVATLVALVVLPLLGVGLSLYLFARHHVDVEIAELNQAALQQRTASLARWLNEQESNLRTITLIDPVHAMLAQTDTTITPPTVLTKLEEQLAKLEQIENDRFLGWRLFNQAGDCIYARPEAETPPVRQESWPGSTERARITTDPLADSAAGPSIWISVRLAVGIDDKTSGALARRINPQKLIDVIGGLSVGKAVRAYLVDSDSSTIIPLLGFGRSAPESALLRAEARRTRAGGIDFYQDYRGREVLGASTKLAAFGGWLVLQQDYPETLGGVHHHWRNIFLLLGLLTVGGIALALFVSTRILRHLDHRDRQSTEQLIAADKLATAGVMAASVAHEINNPLTTINVLIHNLTEETPADRPQRMDLEIALDEIAKIKKIILRFLEFASPQEPQLSEVDINKLLLRCGQLMRHQAAAKAIKYTERLAPDLPTVIADASQMGQVFLNILFNAIEAMPREGTLEISTSTDHQQTVAVQIFNTGPELPSELNEKIFAPFFSTKAQGTGLGLSIARMIVERHGGQITAAAAPGRGTTFTVSLVRDRRENKDG